MHVKRNDLNAKSRMKGDFHVRFRERLRVKFPWSTRQRSIRPLTLNRKNTLFSGSHEAAHAAAIFFSLMGCCRENKVNPKLWMQDVLIRVQEKEREEKNDYSDLLPFNWKG